jgi:hypothetical protein
MLMLIFLHSMVHCSCSCWNVYCCWHHFFPYFLTVIDVPTIACIHIALALLLAILFLLLLAFLLICIYASDGVPAVDGVHAKASAPTMLSSLLILAYAPTSTGQCELQKCYTIGLYVGLWP